MPISTEDLLKILDENKEVPLIQSNYVNEAHRFIVLMKIKEGKHKINSKLLYQVYKMVNKKFAHRTVFINQFSFFFPPELKGTTKIFNLNYKPLELVNRADNMK